MIELIRTDHRHADFQSLVTQLDEYLAEIDGEEHSYYNQFNNIVGLDHCIIAKVNDIVVGCGAFKPFDNHSVEVKRMYTLPKSRGQGVAKSVLNGLEKWAKELGYESVVLETGKRMADAVNFYQNQGYIQVTNYGQYIGVDNSMCFKKVL